MTKEKLFNLIHRLSIEEKSIEYWLDLSVKAYDKDPGYSLPDQARNLLEKHGEKVKVVVLGTTDFSRIFIREAKDHVTIIAVVDDYRAGEGSEFESYPIITSQQLIEHPDKASMVTINGCRYDYSRRYFKNISLYHNIPQLTFEQAIRWLGIDKCSDHRIDDWGKIIASNIQKYINLAKKMGDEYSKITLYSILLAHLNCNFEWILDVARPYLTLYFRSGLWTPSWNERFADCGASLGESTTAFLDATDGHFERLWMIEPDRLNIDTLTKFIDNLDKNNIKEKIELHKCALGETKTEMPFSHQGGHGGQIITSSETMKNVSMTEVNRLDDILSEHPTLIKMDIEGSELSALKGAFHHIKEQRPKLAISAYHRTTDLLDIPDFIFSVRDDYRMGLRHHTEERWDTCLYFY